MPRLAFILAAVLASAPATAVLAQSPDIRSTAQTAVELPFTMAGTQILVDGVRVNGQGPFRFLLDTGAQGWGRADVTLVEALDLPQVGEAGAGDGGGGERRTLSVHRVARIEIGPLLFEDIDLVSRDYNEGGAGGRGPIAGIIGAEMLKGALVTIDYGRGVLRIEPGVLPEPDGKTVLALDPEAPVATVDIDIGGAIVPAHIDTGSMGGITVGEATAAELAFESEPVLTGQARTVSGAFEVRSGVLDGRVVLGQVVRDRPRVSIIPHFVAANLGGQFLKDFVVTLDLANHRVRFEPSAAPPVIEQPRRYGLMMSPPASGETELVLAGVAPGSPAEAGGLKAGDRITALNGVAVADLGDRLPAMMRASPLTIAFTRDGGPREVTLSLD